jgi:uncharacterized membrane protein
MTIGPVQLIVLGFNHPNFQGEILAELERLRRSDTVRVIDALAVYRDAQGELEVEHLSDTVEPGSKIGALIGLRIEDENGPAVGDAGPAAQEGGRIPLDADAWDVLSEIPDDSAAALLLIEHQWAVPLRDAISRAGGFRLADGFVSPFDLIDVGLATLEEAADLYIIENAAMAR